MTIEQRLAYWRQRARDAERVQGYIEAEMESFQRWMTHCFERERHLSDRCTFLYGEAMARGATREDLRQPEIVSPSAADTGAAASTSPRSSDGSTAHPSP